MHFIYYRTIRLSDTDAAGVIYFAQLLSICHEAYEASLETVDIDLKAFFSNAATAIPIVSASIDFFRPIACGDKIAIALTSQPLQASEFEVDYLIYRCDEPDKRLAAAKTKHVCIDPIARSRIPLPALMVKWLAIASPHCENA